MNARGEIAAPDFKRIEDRAVDESGTEVTLKRPVVVDSRLS